MGHVGRCFLLFFKSEMFIFCLFFSFFFNLGISHNEPHRTCFPILPSPPPSLCPLKKEKNTLNKFNLCSPCTYWRRIKLSVASPLGDKSFPTNQKPHTSASLSVSKGSLQWLPVYFLGVYGVLRTLQCLSFSAVILQSSSTPQKKLPCP